MKYEEIVNTYTGNPVIDSHTLNIREYLEEKAVDFSFYYAHIDALTRRFKLIDVKEKMLKEVVFPWLKDYCRRHNLGLDLGVCGNRRGSFVDVPVLITRDVRRS